MVDKFQYDIPKEVRTTITNVDTGDHITLQFEPEMVAGSVAANYNSDPAIGGTHENMKFAHTSNETFSIEMRWNRIIITALRGWTTDRADKMIEDHRAFIRSLANPINISEDIIGGDTPLVNIHVPGVYNVMCRMTNIDWEVPKRDPANGNIMELTMRCTFKEDPVYRYSSDDIFNAGYDRGS